MINIAAITAAVYTRIYSDDPAAAVRAQLGSAASVIPISKLKAGSIPPRPFVALRRMPGPTRDLAPLSYRWFIYDDQQFGYRRISTLIPLIASAYPTPGNAISPIVIPGHTIGTIELSTGPEAEDSALSLYYSYLAITFYTAGPR